MIVTQSDDFQYTEVLLRTPKNVNVGDCHCNHCQCNRCQCKWQRLQYTDSGYSVCVSVTEVFCTLAGQPGLELLALAVARGVRVVRCAAVRVRPGQVGLVSPHGRRGRRGRRRPQEEAGLQDGPRHCQVSVSTKGVERLRESTQMMSLTIAEFTQPCRYFYLGYHMRCAGSIPTPGNRKLILFCHFFPWNREKE